MGCVAELTGDFLVFVPVAGWEIEKEKRDRRKSGGADVALAKRERTADVAVIFIRGGAGKSTSPRGRRRRPRLVYIRTLDGGQKEQKDREECVILTTSQSDRPCLHIHMRSSHVSLF